MFQNLFILCFLLTSLQIAECSQNGALPQWKQEAYKNILSISSQIEREELPFKTNDITENINFLDSRDLNASQRRTIIVVLGGMPLDESTPTIDLVYRVLKGVQIAQENSNSLIIMTG